MSSSQLPDHSELATHIVDGVYGEVNSVSIIGSYLLSKEVRPGSDIDIIVAVSDLGSTALKFGNVVYKDATIKDPVGERKELNTDFRGTTLDITVIDEFNTPSSPLTDGYENAIGSCMGSLTIYGQHLRDLFGLDEIIAKYADIKEGRKKIVEEKIASTKQKISEQGRTDLHILYELQKYVFIRECIRGGIFNRLSIKHPTNSIPNFDAIFAAELASSGIAVAVTPILVAGTE